MKIYCFDLDNTLCKSHLDDYTKSEPIHTRIDQVNKLFAEGNRIIICTARGSLTGIDWKVLTEQQLRDWSVRYHELWLGKPYADIYVDDKACKDTDFQWD